VFYISIKSEIEAKRGAFYSMDFFEAVFNFFVLILVLTGLFTLACLIEKFYLHLIKNFPALRTGRAKRDVIGDLRKIPKF